MKTRIWLTAVLCLALGCAKVPNDPNDPANPVWNPDDLRGPMRYNGPIVYLSPGMSTVRAGSQFGLEIRAMNFATMEAERVKGIHLVLGLPPGIAFTKLDTLGFLRESGGTVFGWAETTGDSLTLDLVRVGDPPATPADSGSVARIWLRASQEGQISVDKERCALRNSNNNPIQNVETRGAWVEVMP